MVTRCLGATKVKELQNVYFSRFRTFSSWTFDVLDFLAFTERAWVAFHVIGMNKEIFSTVVWCDKPKTFLGIEKFNCTFRFHRNFLLIFSNLLHSPGKLIQTGCKGLNYTELIVFFLVFLENFSLNIVNSLSLMCYN